MGSLLVVVLFCVLPPDLSSRGQWIGGSWYGHGRLVDRYQMRRTIATLELWNNSPYYRPMLRRQWTLERLKRGNKR